MIVVTECMKEYLSDIKRISLILDHILSFDYSITIPNSLIQLTSLNLSLVPNFNIYIQSKIVKFNFFEKE